jgi:flavin-dependent thymidylate synthase
MKVELIYFTGSGHKDPARAAAELLVYAKSTRLEQSPDTRAKIASMSWGDIEKELNYAAKTIRSSWEFIDFYFQINGVTRAFTHQLVRTRTGSYAQQAQRVVDMTGFGYTTPPTIESAPEDVRGVWHSAMEDISEAYSSLRVFDIPAQDARGILPTNIHTNILAKFNLRTLADLVGKRENLRATGEYADVVRLMKQEALVALPWIEPFLNPERTATPALDALLKERLGDRAPHEVPGLADALKELDALKGVWG